jgi:hypothetical protein
MALAASQAIRLQSLQIERLRLGDVASLLIEEGEVGEETGVTRIVLMGLLALCSDLFEDGEQVTITCQPKGFPEQIYLFLDGICHRTSREQRMSDRGAKLKLNSRTRWQQSLILARRATDIKRPGVPRPAHSGLWSEGRLAHCVLPAGA